MGTRLWLDLCRELLWKLCRYHLARGRNQFLIIESVKPCYLRLPEGSMFVWSPVLFGNVLKLEFQICKLRFRQESIPPPRVHNDTTSMLNNHFGARGFDINLTRSMFTYIYIYIMCVCPIKPYCIPSLNPIKWIKTQQSPTWTAPKNWFSTNKNEDDWSVADLYKFVADNNCDLVIQRVNAAVWFKMRFQTDRMGRLTVDKWNQCNFGVQPAWAVFRIANDWDFQKSQLKSSVLAPWNSCWSSCVDGSGPEVMLHRSKTRKFTSSQFAPSVKLNSDPTTCWLLTSTPQCHLTAGSWSRIQLLRKRLPRSWSLQRQSWSQKLRGQLPLDN